jgi:hypothetical protein
VATGAAHALGGVDGHEEAKQALVRAQGFGRVAGQRVDFLSICDGTCLSTYLQRASHAPASPCSPSEFYATLRESARSHTVGRIAVQPPPVLRTRVQCQVRGSLGTTCPSSVQRRSGPHTDTLCRCGTQLQQRVLRLVATSPLLLGFRALSCWRARGAPPREHRRCLNVGAAACRAAGEGTGRNAFSTRGVSC